jgi:hypothetical protein
MTTKNDQRHGRLSQALVDTDPPCKDRLGVNAVKNGMEGSWAWTMPALKTANA